jgi:hypothetical protein
MASKENQESDRLPMCAAKRTSRGREIKYIGMDVHKEAVVIALLNGSGKLVMESIVETKASSILQFIHGRLARCISQTQCQCPSRSGPQLARPRCWTLASVWQVTKSYTPCGRIRAAIRRAFRCK